MMRQRSVLAGLVILGLVGCKKPGNKPAATAKAATSESSTAATTAAPDRAAAAIADRAKAKTLNSQGMKAYRAKDFVAAAESFRAAIAADASFVLPHYNLACVASLSDDKTTARAELEWLFKSTDPQARRTLLKASSDQDMAPLAKDPQAQKILQLAGVFPGYRASELDESASEADAKRLEKSAGDRADECEEAHTAARTIQGELAADHPGAETLVVSLADGATLFDSAGKVVARGEPLDPDCASGSQAALFHVSLGQVIADDEPEIVLHWASGGHGDSYMESISVLKRRGDKLVSLISNVVAGNDKGVLSIEPDGKILVRELGKKALQAKIWDAAKFQLVDATLPAAPATPTAPADPAAVVATASTADRGILATRTAGWTADSAYLVYATDLEIDPNDSDPGYRLTVHFNHVVDASTGQDRMYVMGLWGEPTKKEKKEYAKYPQAAAFKSWGKEHATRCIGGRSSPDGTITTEIKVAGSAKKKHGRWKKDKFLFARDDDFEEMPSAEELGSITLQMSLLKAGKPFATASWTGSSYLDGELFGDVRLCWAPNSQRAVLIVTRERGMMRDPGDTTILIAGVAKTAVPLVR